MAEPNALETLAAKYSYTDNPELSPEASPEPPAEAPTEETPPVEEALEEPKETEALPAPAPMPSGLLDRAAAVGVSAGDAAAFSTQVDLEAAVRLLEGRIPPATEEAAEPQGEQFPEYKVEIDGEEADANTIIKAIEGLAKHQASQNAEVVKYVQGALQQTEQQAQTSSAMQWFDAKVESLGTEWESIFGKGPTRSLPQNSQEYVRRQALMGSVGGIGSSRPDLPDDKVFEFCTKEFEGLVSKEVPQQRQVVSRPNKAVPSDSGDPFSRVRAMHAEMVRDNGDE